MSTEFEATEALRHIALDETVKSYVLQHQPIYQALRHAAMRFIGGETLTQCVGAKTACSRSSAPLVLTLSVG